MIVFAKQWKDFDLFFILNENLGDIKLAWEDT